LKLGREAEASLLCELIPGFHRAKGQAEPSSSRKVTLVSVRRLLSGPIAPPFKKKITLYEQAAKKSL
jgi:hypothetical protein